ncbi:MAG: hypothetical protein ACREAE_01555, partial [Nitrosopumilaceae archaeon]
HDAGHSFSDMTTSKFYYITRNRIYVCLKNYSLRNIICRVPAMLFLMFLGTIFYELSRKPTGYMRTLFKAIFWNMSNLISTMKEHKKLRLTNKISDKELESYLIHSSIELSLIRNRSLV